MTVELYGPDTVLWVETGPDGVTLNVSTPFPLNTIDMPTSPAPSVPPVNPNNPDEPVLPDPTIPSVPESETSG